MSRAHFQTMQNAALTPQHDETLRANGTNRDVDFQRIEARWSADALRRTK